MEVSELEQLLQTADHSGANQGRRIELKRLELVAVAHLGAIDPGGGEHPGGAEHPLHPGHIHGIVVSKQVGESLSVVRFLDVIDLLEQAATEFIDDVAESKAEVERQQRGCDDTEKPDQNKVTAKNEGEVGALNFDGDPGLAFQTGLVDLSEAGSGNGSVGEFGEQLLGRCPQFLFNARQGQGMGEWGEIVLKARQFIQPVPAYQIRSGGEGLSHLDETGPQPRQGVEDPTGERLLNQWIGTASSQHKNQHQAGQGPQHLDQPGDRHPGAQKQPAKITPGVISHRHHPDQAQTLKRSRWIP